MRNNPIHGKKEKARADAVRKEHERIKKGEFKNKAEEFRWNKFRKREEGANLKATIGLENVYKEKKEFEPSFFNPLALFQQLLDPKGKKQIKDTTRGYWKLKLSRLPVTKYKGKKIIRGKERLVFEKAVSIKKEEMPLKIDEIMSIVNKAAKKNMFFDAQIANFGINKEGKVVIRDTNYTTKRLFRNREEVRQKMLENLTLSLKEEKIDKKIIEKIK